MVDTSLRLRWSDFLLIAVYAFVLFGYSGLSGRPLTMHEARLPETAREMMESGHWLLPHSGNRPWLERPPLPHWVVIGSMKIFGRDDREWIVRLPSALMGLMTVLLIAAVAARGFGRTIGLLSGLILATSFEFYQYSSLAEDDIYLGALVAICLAIFFRAESSHPNDENAAGFFENRRWTIWAFFIVLGSTNLAKGPLLGMAIVGVTVGSYLLWNALTGSQWKSLRRYVWFWGWLILFVLTIAWPLCAYRRYPDVLANWKYDYLGRVSGTYSDITQPWYYYGGALAVAMLPWTPACIIGLFATAGDAFRPKIPAGDGLSSAWISDRQKALRLVWCWAILPLILFSIPKGKHHHYLIPFLAPWAILGAFGIVEIGKRIFAASGWKYLRDPLLAICFLGFPGAVAIAWFHNIIPGPPRLTLLLVVLWLALISAFFTGLKRSNGQLLMMTILATLLVGYCWGETFLAAAKDHTVDDTAFLRRVITEVPPDDRLFVNANLDPAGNLDFFRMQFYCPRASLLHNLTYLRDENIHDSQVFIIARAADEKKLEQLGSVAELDRSMRSHDCPPGWTQAQASFTLFRLTFDPNLKRYSAPTQITNMQAMQRDRTGPWCGPAL